ncbi:cation:proton antiporter [Pyrococcus furiosus DSM 3638]|uniref:Multisubunit Na+/H+ antiporter n=3 Tax=Pyrococcus furiosus TaxID=2261 RepID=Q8U1Q5_PYRFU|nr:hydrogenase subunit MbhD domain-containing protein [Pyrococcus furiosus]AAL81274.1 putative multisubunit Na+/H+ antiporter [Pyrococcus furiosus DSM 3638]AFN03942.1 monovalent cation/H+ antiporter subunit B [Pyrococcus furiosus COM1]QEK78805.1 cation:proton antiporter [Pyrococcus furiosus DSM 3638]
MDGTILEIITGIIAVTLALITVLHKKFLASLISYSLASLLLALLAMTFRAPDVALSLIVVGALVIGLFIFAHEETREEIKIDLKPGIAVIPLLLLLLKTRITPNSLTYEAYLSVWNLGNLVTEILAGWRFYDSVGEALILFSAAVGFSIVVRRVK